MAPKKKGVSVNASRRKRSKKTMVRKQPSAKIGSGKVHAFTRVMDPDVVLQLMNATTGYARGFKLSELPVFSEFTGLFDQYMIDRVDVMIRMRDVPENPFYTGTTTNRVAIPYPTMWYYSDFDDDTPPSSLQMVKAREGVRMAILDPRKVIKYSFQPCVSIQSYASTAGTSTVGFLPKPKTWIDSSFFDVMHYGFKAAFDNLGIAPGVQGPVVHFSYKIHIKCRNFH